MIAGWLGCRSLYLIGWILDPLYQFLMRDKKRRIAEQMRTASGGRISDSDLNRCVKQYVTNSINRSLDDFHLTDSRKAERIPASVVEGLDHLTQAVQSGRGVLLISGHFFANRVGKRYLARIGHPVMSVRNGKPPDFRMGWLGWRFLQPQYVRFLTSVIQDEVLTQDPDCVLKIFQRLRRGGIVNIHIDTPFQPAVCMPFLGRKKMVSTGLLEVMRLTGCAVLPILFLGNQQSSRICIEEPLTLDVSLSRDDFVAQHLPQMMAILERQILAHPSEWELWSP